MHASLGMGAEEQQEDQPLVVRLGPVVVDVPRSVGFYGGIALAVGFEVIGPEIGLIIAAVPLVKFLKRKHATKVERMFAGLFEGAAKPIGGDAEAVVQPSWVADEKQRRSEHEPERPGLARRLGKRLLHALPGHS